MKQILADLHTHSVGSIHAYNTITELIDKTDIPYLAVTDHIFDLGTPMLNLHTNKYISHIHREFKSEPRLIAGVELDIDTSLDNQYGLTLETIPLTLLSYHGGIPLTVERYIEYIDTIHPTIIAHPYRIGRDEISREMWEEIVRYAAAQGCVIEINEKSVDALNPAVLQSLNCSFSLGSDAHSWYKVGKLDKAIDFVETYLPHKHIVNYDKDWLEDARLGKLNHSTNKYFSPQEVQRIKDQLYNPTDVNGF